MQLSRLALNPYGFIGFGVASVFSVVQTWSLTEFCWSTWLAGLIYSWGCIAAAVLQLILTARAKQPKYAEYLPFLKNVSPAVFLLIMTGLSITIGIIVFQLYVTIFGLYGTFLSVFAEMEPVALFGRNGFINSDFFTPLLYLLYKFWPMAAGALILNWKTLFLNDPWKRLVLPFQEELLRIHVMTIVLPFFSMLAWALFKGAYQGVTIVLLMVVFYFVPKASGPVRSANFSDKPQASN